MKRLTKIILLMLAGFSILLSSCKNEIEGENNPVQVQYINLDKNTAYISLSIESASSVLAYRTILPAFDSFTGFEQFLLTGKKDGSDDSFTREFKTERDAETGEVTKAAYDALNGAIIPLPFTKDDATETWTFTLTGWYGGAKGETPEATHATTYEGTKSVPVTKGTVSGVSISLARTSAYDYSSETKGAIAFNLKFADVTVVSVDAVLTPKKTGGTTGSTTFSVSEQTASIAFLDVLPGEYTIKCTFKGVNGIQVGTMQETVYVLSGLTSKTTDPDRIIDVNAVYTITYKQGDDAFTDFAEGVEIPYKFSRFSDVTLPTADALAATFAASNIFLGWYEDSGFATPITGIEKNTKVANLTVYGKFISAREMPTVAGVQFASDASLKVGHKLTATPYYMDGDTKKDFLGTIKEWKWYVGDEGSGWTEITEGITTTDESPAGDETPAASSIWLKPAYAGKQIKVAVVQKHTITDSDGNGIYEIADNTASKESATEQVAKGTLAAGDTFKLYYNAGETVVRSVTDLSAERITIDSTVKGGIHDANDANHDSAWTLTALGITPTIVFASSAPAKAPEASGYYEAVLSAAGYEDLSLTGTNGVFIKVRYAPPTKDEARSVLWKTGDSDETNTMTLDCITLGCIAFKKNKVAGVTVYRGTTKSDISGYSDVAATAAEDHSTCQMSLPQGGLVLGFKKNGVTETDGKGNVVGFIDDSDTTTLSTDDLAGYIGTREIIRGVVMSSENEKGIKTGSTVTFHITSDVAGEQRISQYNDVTWTWKFGESAVEASPAATITHCITQADFVAGSGKMTVGANRTYPIIGDRGVYYNNSLTQPVEIAKGDLTAPSFTYTGGSKLPDDSVSTDLLRTDIAPKDAISGATIEWSIKTVSEVSESDDGRTGSVQVTVSATGYNDKTVTVGNIPLQTPAPEPTNPANPMYTSFELSTEKDAISLGYIQFSHPDDRIYDCEISVEDDSQGEPVWQALTTDEFKESADSFKIRFKQSGMYNEQIYWYDTGTNTWASKNNDVLTAIEFSNYGMDCTARTSGGQEVTVTQIINHSSSSDISVDESNRGIRGVKDFAVTVTYIDMQLTSQKANGKVTITPKSGYSVSRWRIDGMSVAQFMESEGISSGVTATTGGGSGSLELTLSALKEGTYQVSAYGTDSNGITYSAGASIVVSK